MGLEATLTTTAGTITLPGSDADPAVAKEVTNSLILHASSSYQRRERFADADSEDRLVEMKEAAGTRRQTYQIMNNLVVNQITSDQTGSDDKLSERILNQRSAQAQPQEQTANDPNFRAGAVAPGQGGANSLTTTKAA